jgi:alanine racemase
MNHIVADFGGWPVAENDEVVLFGPGDEGEPTPQDWADALGTISYEVVTSFGRTLPRSYSGVAYGQAGAGAGAAAGRGAAPSP